MKTYRKIMYLIMGFICFFMVSCEDYLDKTVKADITEDQIFSSFQTYQGFVEKMYYDVIDFSVACNNAMDFNWGDDVALNHGWRYLQEGNQMLLTTGSGTPYHYNDALAKRGYTINSAGFLPTGVWNSAWPGIRDANIALSHLDDLVNATAEEKQLLEGQAYFFRAYLHWVIMKQWGGIPYTDKVYSATDMMNSPQLTFYGAADKVIADLQKAAELLPVDWDNTTVGQATLGSNRGRLTKGMALSFLAEVNLWCASPLVNGTCTGNYVYNIDYCKKAAAAAWKVIEMADQGVYTLEPWATYSDLFKKNDRTEPGRVKEVIFKPLWSSRNARWFVAQWQFVHLGGGTLYTSPTQNLVELFEMQATGLPIEDPASGFNPQDPWAGRDPRFAYNILVDQERIVLNRNDVLAFAQLYTGGRDRGAGQSISGFGFKKFMFTNWNSYDNGWNNSGIYCLPIIRLAEIYLFYAEAVNEAYGPGGKDPGANLTAVDAVNKIRNRAQMPNVDSKFTATADAFRERIRNERSVELCCESKRRDDQRRWYIAHETKYKDLYACNFPKDHSQFTKSKFKSIVFDSKHYWLPFPITQIQLYEGWKQNPGW